jgi:hypothetical protein
MPGVSKASRPSVWFHMLRLASNPCATQETQQAIQPAEVATSDSPFALSGNHHGSQKSSNGLPSRS